MGEKLVDLLPMFGFLSIFHLVGGIAIGLGWRQWASAWRKEVRTPPFLFIWGVLFGLLPLLFALVMRDWRLLAGQGVVLLIGWALAFWLAQPFGRAISRRFLWFIVVGAILMIVGSLLAVLAMDAGAEKIWERLASGGVLFALGSIILAAGLVQWLRPRPKGEAPAPAPVTPEPLPATATPPAPTEMPAAEPPREQPAPPPSEEPPAPTPGV